MKKRLFSKILMVLMLFALGLGMVGCGDKTETSLEDGIYNVNVSLVGGTGKATIQSPATMTVTDGQATVLLVWTSKNYDYMMVDGVKYINEAEAGCESAFTIPYDLTNLGKEIEVIGDTTAMSTPHEITYSLTLELEK